MNNLLSYCGLIDAKIRASDKYLRVCYLILHSLLENLTTHIAITSGEKITHVSFVGREDISFFLFFSILKNVMTITLHKHLVEQIFDTN